MMPKSNQQTQLWWKLSAFQFDRGEVAFPFAARLAQEQGWTWEYAERVIEEYKRFLLLAATTSTPVTPPQAVDEAWHLHLTYTKSYWQDLCDGVLGKPLHHNPTEGGKAQDAKFRMQYADTLAQYKGVFGEAPPEDIWPNVERRFAATAGAMKSAHVPQTKSAKSHGWFAAGATAAVLMGFAMLAGGKFVFVVAAIGLIAFAIWAAQESQRRGRNSQDGGGEFSVHTDSDSAGDGGGDGGGGCGGGGCGS